MVDRRRAADRSEENILQGVRFMYRALQRGWAAPCPACGGDMMDAGEGGGIEKCNLCDKKFKMRFGFWFLNEISNYIKIIGLVIVTAMSTWYFGLTFFASIVVLDSILLKYWPRKSVK